MSPAVLFFGAIGTLAETSDLQRRAFNRAFLDAGLDWHWDADTYAEMLKAPGGLRRIEAYADRVGDRVDTSAIYLAKKRHFGALVRSRGIEPRPGVAEMLLAAERDDIPVGLCSGTDPDQVDLILDNLGPDATREQFAWIADSAEVERDKPAPDIYDYALDAMGVPPDRALAIEDTPESAEAALAAGLPVVGFPGRASAGREFQPGVLVVDRLRERLLALGLRGAVAAE